MIKSFFLREEFLEKKVLIKSKKSFKLSQICFVFCFIPKQDDLEFPISESIREIFIIHKFLDERILRNSIWCS